MQTITPTQAVLTLIKTLPPIERKTIYVWLSKHKADFEEAVDTSANDEQFWLNASSDAIEQLWGEPEEDIWDEIYQKQKENDQLQTV